MQTGASDWRRAYKNWCALTSFWFEELLPEAELQVLLLLSQMVGKMNSSRFRRAARHAHNKF